MDRDLNSDSGLFPVFSLQFLDPKIHLPLDKSHRIKIDNPGQFINSYPTMNPSITTAKRFGVTNSNRERCWID